MVHYLTPLGVSISLQVPLTTRIFDDEYESQKNNLIQRSQICSTRLKDNEPVLVCDFISDIQMVILLIFLASQSDVNLKNWGK
jgi:hypothetical protein